MEAMRTQASARDKFDIFQAAVSVRLVRGPRSPRSSRQPFRSGEVIDEAIVAAGLSTTHPQRGHWWFSSDRWIPHGVSLEHWILFMIVLCSRSDACINIHY